MRGPGLPCDRIMGAIEDIYEDLDADVSIDDFEAAVAEKVEQMGGLADEETAAMLIAHELGDRDVNGIADIEPGMDEVEFAAKVTGIGEMRTFERDDDDTDGQVINVEAADETGQIRLVFWDEQATAVVEEDLQPGTVLRVKGRPREGYQGVEVSVTRVESDPDVDIDVEIRDEYRVEDLSLGQSDVTVAGEVLAVEDIRTFQRDDGSEGRVSNLTIGDETGRIRVTLWDDRTAAVEDVDIGDVVEVSGGSVRERDGDLEVHVGNRGAVRSTDEQVEFVPQTTPIAELEIDDRVDIGGVIRSVDPKRTFERDDGSEGQVRNVRVQDESGDVRVALWGEKADAELSPGDTAYFTDVEISDGWQDDIEGSVGWRSTITVTDRPVGEPAPAADEGAVDLGSFDGNETADSGSVDADADGDSHAENGDDGTSGNESDDSRIEFTGTVVQTGDPVILDDGTETVTVATDADVSLGQEVTARGTRDGGHLDADDII